MTTLRSFLLSTVACSTLFASAQAPPVLSDSTTQAIDAEVWRPFVNAFNMRDAEAFMALHAKPVIRWPLGWGLPQTADSLRVQSARNWSLPVPQGEVHFIELYFTHRSHTDSFEFDIGYYRVVIMRDDGNGRQFVGHFSTILGKAEGRWKIFLDADNSDGVTDEALKHATPLRME
ncbi:MAG: hypothetical protein IPI81_13225 [Flavobacteriales bacterium]|nr:hypothetical protein [Flavobacteriales bacterium]